MDNRQDDYEISGINRISSMFLPSAWDDLKVSGIRENWSRKD
jgi:hypothetical protein